MKTNRSYVIIVSLIIGIFVVFGYSLFNIFGDNKKIEYKVPASYRDANQYDLIHVSESEMVQNYMSSFIDLIYNNIDEAYSLLDIDNETIDSFDKFKNYLAKITTDYTVVPQIESYKIENIKNKICYYIVDTNGYKYIFLVEGVMNYTVFLDTSINAIKDFL